LVLLLPLMRRAVPAVPGWGVAAVVVLAAVVLRDVGSVSVRPPWNRVAMPSEDEALQLFEVLQNNVYRAFSARTEDEIYDLLAVSVDPEILDQLYGDVYESLILRGQGGAVCVIDRIEVLDKSIAGFDDSGGSPRFDVNWQWRVFGVVSHWGHQHKRTNQYRARYSVHHDGHSWKIAKVVVLDHSRVDEDG